MMSKPWYYGGLEFECLGCGQCCTGEPGHVWVSDREVETLAAVVELDVPEFERTFVRVVGSGRSLIEQPNGDCVFFDNRTRRCKVYDAHPAQCRTWPFWGSNLRTRSAWQETCRACPGSGRGPPIPLHEIEARLGAIEI